MSELKAALSLAQGQVDGLKAAIEALMLSAPVTDEHLEHTLSYMGRDRYILLRPDGERYWNVPFFQPYPGTSFVQRPAALRAARNIPGCRIYDTKERMVVTDG